jgi:hypothetical protein
MTTSRAAGTFIALLAVLVLAGSVRPEADAGRRQIEAGDLANWADLSTWSIPNRETRQLEVGMGLVLSGPSGAMRLAFYVNQPMRGTVPEPASVGFRVASSLRMNPNLLRTPTLVFTAVVRNEEDELEEVELDLSSAMMVDNPAPGAAITSGVGSMSVEAFKTLADAEEISANILGAKVEFGDEQREAVTAFRDKLFPSKR